MCAFPTGSFVCLLFVLLAIWYAGSSQNNAAADLLLFALGGVFLVSIPHAFLNLAGLEVGAESVQPAFAGHEVSLGVEISNQARAPRHGLSVRLANAPDAQRVDHIAARKAVRVRLRFPARARGEHEIGEIQLASVYPLGFLRALKRFASSQRYVVYPQPAGDAALPVDPERTPQFNRGNNVIEGDDFAGVRAYVPGESQRHIDWKAVARGQALMTKQYAAEASGILFFSYDAVSLSDPEERLSQLTLWIIEAERAQRPYGLRLPRLEIAPSIGDAHFHRCLRELALFK